MPEHVNTTPCATKFHEIDAQECRADRDHGALLREEARRATRAATGRSAYSTIMIVLRASTPCERLAHARRRGRAPKFWPAIGAAANAIAIAGRKIACMMREPMPNPACAGRAEMRGSPSRSRHVDEHQRELAAGRQADVEHPLPDVELRRATARDRNATYFSSLHEVEPRAARRRSRSTRARKPRAGDAERYAGAPARDQDRREQRVQEHREHLHRPSPACTMPVPRSAEPIATSANCSARPGRNQSRYSTPARLRLRVGADDRADVRPDVSA